MTTAKQEELDNYAHRKGFTWVDERWTRLESDGEDKYVRRAYSGMFTGIVFYDADRDKLCLFVACTLLAPFSNF